MFNALFIWILIGIAFCIAEVLQLMGNASRFIGLFKGLSAFAVAALSQELSIPLQVITWLFIDIALWQVVNLYMIITNNQRR